MVYEAWIGVVNMSVTAGLVIVCVLLARLALKRAPKVFSYVLWAAVLFRLLCPVSLPSPLSVLNLLSAPVSAGGTVDYIPPTWSTLSSPPWTSPSPASAGR